MPGPVGISIVDEDGQNVDIEDLMETELDLEQKEAMVDPKVLALHKAVENSDIEAAVALLQEVPPNSRGVDGDTALHLACLYGIEPVVPVLISKGADVNLTDEEGSTPLHDAAAGGYAGIVEQLLKAGAAVTVQDSDGDTALHNAANGDHIAVVKMLLAAGADKTVENGEGNTPAMVSTEDEVIACFE